MSLEIILLILLGLSSVYFAFMAVHFWRRDMKGCELLARSRVEHERLQASQDGLAARLKAANEALAEDRARPPIGLAVTAPRPEWTQQEAELFRIWLATPVGRKFAGILLFDEQKQNRSAVLRISNHEYNAGFAAGFHARSESLLQLSADVRPQQDEDSGEREGATPLAERYAS